MTSLNLGTSIYFDADCIQPDANGYRRIVEWNGYYDQFQIELFGHDAFAGYDLGGNLMYYAYNEPDSVAFCYGVEDARLPPPPPYILRRRLSGSERHCAWNLPIHKRTIETDNELAENIRPGIEDATV